MANTRYLDAEAHGEMIERASDAVDTVDHHERRLSVSAPVNDVDAEAVHLDETVRGLTLRSDW